MGWIKLLDTINITESDIPSLSASKISDFSESVAANSAVVANTAKNSYPSGDAIKVGRISVSKAVDLDNMIDIEKGVSSRVHDVIDDEEIQLTWEEAGYIPVDLSKGDVEITMPAMDEDHIGVEFCFAIIQAGIGNELTIIADEQDYGFSLLTGSLSNVTGYIVMSTLESDVIVKSGIPRESTVNKWFVIGGNLVQIVSPQ